MFSVKCGRSLRSVLNYLLTLPAVFDPSNDALSDIACFCDYADDIHSCDNHVIDGAPLRKRRSYK